MKRRELLRTLGMGAAAISTGCMPNPPPPPPARRDAVVVPFESVPAIDGAGATVHRVFPSDLLGHQDPFVLLDDFHVTSPAGFPTHPHRGFEAFTYMIDGAFEHRDNLGNVSVITNGGVQRFTSGSGAYHSEMPASDATSVGLQLWVNLPRRLKTMPPEYVGIRGEMIPERARDGVRVRTVVGQGSPSFLRTEVEYLDVAYDRATRFEREVYTDLTTLIYVIRGEIEASGVRLSARQGARIEPGRLRVVGGPESRFVYLSGRPLDEPIYQHGPFVD